MRGNLAIYERGLRAQTRPCIPVASIGNITLGGTGKTTTTRRLTRDLRKAGLSPGIVLRGHKRSGQASELLISDGNGLLVEGNMAGDEAAMLATTAEAPVAVGKRRERVVQLLQDEGATVALLDDGFQYFRMRRVVDLVLIDATFNLPEARVFPAGYLREPLDHLRRATHLLITHADLVDEDRITRTIELLREHAPEAPLMRSRHAPAGAYQLDDPDTMIAVDELAGSEVMAVSAVGNPASFEALLQQIGADVAAKKVFPDHHAYLPEDWDRVREALNGHKVDMIAVTEKDAVKLTAAPLDLPPVVAVAVDLEITHGTENWDVLIERLQQASR